MRSREGEDFAPIGEYAVIGDLLAGALENCDRAIDWFPFLDLDSAPTSSALVDPAGGGWINLVPYAVQRRYLEGTAVLATSVVTSTRTATVTDSLDLATMGELPWTERSRRIIFEEGEVPMAWRVVPGYRFAIAEPWIHWREDVPMILIGDSLVAVITNNVGEPRLTREQIEGDFIACTGTPALLAVVGSGATPLRVLPPKEAADRADMTSASWHRWRETIQYQGPWKDEVARSAMVLKMLVRSNSGAMAATGTTSLSEKIGGDWNFAYRFSWIRDALFALDALGRVGWLDDPPTGELLGNTPQALSHLALIGAATVVSRSDDGEPSR